MQRIFKNKWLIVILVFAALLTFEKNIPKLSLLNRGLVIGMAVDFENDELVFTAQMVLPSNRDTSGGQYSVFESQGRNIEEAINNMSNQTGNVVSLGQCGVLILGRSVLERGDFSSVSYLMKEERVPESMFVMSSEAHAGDLLRSDVVVEEVSSYHFIRLFNNSHIYLGLNRINLKDFFSNYYTEGGANYLPVAVAIESEDVPEQGTGVSNSSDHLFEMDLNRTAIMTRDGYKTTLNKRESDGLTLVIKKVTRGGLDIRANDGTEININIVQSKAKMQYDLETMTATVNVKVKAKLLDRTTINGIGDDHNLDDEEIALLEEDLKARIMECFEKCKEESTDVFNLYSGFYKKYGRKWEQIAKKDYLDDLNLQVNVNVSTR